MNCKNFFIIEDHTLTNFGIRELLKEKYSCVGYAFNKDEALQKLAVLKQQNTVPEIIILDLFLGDESGIDLLKYLKSTYPEIKVVVYSMYKNPGIISLVLENKADGFILKSAPESELLNAIGKILNGETYVQQSLISPLFTYRTIFDGLTKQEQIIFKKLIERKSKLQITKELNIVMRSLENYLSRIYMKTGCKNHEDLINRFS